MSDETGRLTGILRTRATLERHKNPDGYNGLAANFEAAADLLELQSTEHNELVRAIVDGYAELTETHGSLEANYNEAARILKPLAFKYADSVSGKQ